MRILHTMIRVRDLNKSIKFYTNTFNLKILKNKDYPEGRFTLVFLGYEEQTKQANIELTYNWDTHEYNLGNGFGHIAIQVEDIYEICNRAKSFGGQVTREPGPMKFGGSSVIAFVEDPNGYKIELIQLTHHD